MEKQANLNHQSQIKAKLHSNQKGSQDPSLNPTKTKVNKYKLTNPLSSSTDFLLFSSSFLLLALQVFLEPLRVIFGVCVCDSPLILSNHL